MLDNLIRQLEEKIELADKRNFESVYLTLKPSEAKELLELLNGLPILKEELEKLMKELKE